MIKFWNWEYVIIMEAFIFFFGLVCLGLDLRAFSCRISIPSHLMSCCAMLRWQLHACGTFNTPPSISHHSSDPQHCLFQLIFGIEYFFFFLVFHILSVTSRKNARTVCDVILRKFGVFFLYTIIKEGIWFFKYGLFYLQHNRNLFSSFRWGKAFKKVEISSFVHRFLYIFSGMKKHFHLKMG